MNREEALKLLQTAPTSTKPCAINPAFTQAEGVKIVIGAVEDMKPGRKLGRIMEKRVWQMVKQQRRPRY